MGTEEIRVKQHIMTTMTRMTKQRPYAPGLGWIDAYAPVMAIVGQIGFYLDQAGVLHARIIAPGTHADRIATATLRRNRLDKIRRRRVGIRRRRVIAIDA
jgi:hypothetical protein